MPALDVFHNDAFSLVTLTDAINKLKYVPGRLGSLGLFQSSGVITTSVFIDERDGILSLIAPTPRGGPGNTISRMARTARSFRVPHFEINDAVMADEVQGVRAWGSETEVETVQGKVGEHLVNHTQSMAATEEYAFVGAVKGVITYADGSTLNLFSEFDVTPPADVYLDLTAASPVAGALRAKISGIGRTIGAELSTIPFSGLYAVCGDDFFDALTKHSEVRDTFLSYQAAADLRAPLVGSPAAMGSWGTFSFAGVLWDNYFGKVGSTTFVGTDEAYIFPMGVPNLFREYFAPADYVETVNTVGLRLYTRQYEMQNQKGIHLDSQMNALAICTRPGVLIHAHKLGS